MNTNSVEQLIHDLACRFIQRRYPEESSLFDVVWDQCRHVPGDLTKDGTQADQLIRGLPFAAQDPGALVSPYVLLTLQAVFREMTARGEAPDSTAIDQAIRCSAEAFGAPPRLVNELANDLSADLEQAFLSGALGARFRADDVTGLADGSSQAVARDESESRADVLFIKRVVDGIPRKSGWCRRRVRNSNRRNPRYDIVVDEINGDVIVRPYRNAVDNCTCDPVWIDQIDPRAAGLLWLALENFGRHVTFDSISDLFGLDDAQTDTIYRPRAALADLLGVALRDALVGKSRGRRYPIGRGQVNFCWMRRSDQGSDLRDRAAQPVDD